MNYVDDVLTRVNCVNDINYVRRRECVKCVHCVKFYFGYFTADYKLLFDKIIDYK